MEPKRTGAKLSSLSLLSEQSLVATLRQSLFWLHRQERSDEARTVTLLAPSLTLRQSLRLVAYAPVATRRLSTYIKEESSLLLEAAPHNPLTRLLYISVY